MPISKTKTAEQNVTPPTIENVGYLEGMKGKKSIKRLWGSILLANALAIGWLVVMVALMKPGFNMDNPIKVMEYIFGIGGFLLGINVLQYWRGGR
jgi:hypothetical protein